MTRFFIRLKGWQLTVLMMAAFFIPVLIFIGQLISELSRESKPAEDIVRWFLRAAGMATFLQVLVNFAWQRTTSSYLFGLLRDKDNEDYTRLNWFLFFTLIYGLTIATFFFTGYVFYFFYYVLNHTWVVFPFLLLIIGGLFFVRKGFAFTYKASEALLNDTSYKSIRVDWFSIVFFRPFVLQNRIRQVYLKYGDSTLD
ncbi:MAG TPA: hypothetical protein VFI06_03795 [Chitinophagaceae bacterium]|nr:hypothetical protein [Chitinophagaceae bacterium]